MVLTPTRPVDLPPRRADRDHLEPVMRAACARVAPVWPLERFVAVNPYLGLADLRFEDAARWLAVASGARATMPIPSYLELVAQGRITEHDLGAVLAERTDAPTTDPAQFLATVRRLPTAPAAARVPTVVDVATATSGNDWRRFMIDRVSAWASAYFDTGQAIWAPTQPRIGPFAAWRHDASIDRTPEIMGLARFRATVRSLPDDPFAAAVVALGALGIPDAAREQYLHALLLVVPGWSAHAARLGWERAQHGAADDTLVELLTVLLAWEMALLQSPALPRLGTAWSDALAALESSGALPDGDATILWETFLQDAFDRAAQRVLIDACNEAPVARATATSDHAVRPVAQAAFCIDVRSEVFRRHLEAAAPGLETIGFAGFFGVPIEYRPLAHEHGDAHCPVLLTPGATVPETLPDGAATVAASQTRRLRHHVRRAWKSFKMGAVSCFSFVGPVGLAYLPKLVTDGLGVTRPVPDPGTEGLPRALAGRLAPDVSGIPVAERLRLAEGTLRGMSLTHGLAPVVLLVGHGATTVNNPYASGLDCGACGGHGGAANARVAAALLNDADVREQLGARGIVVPDDTWFVAALHDTTTDAVRIFDDPSMPPAHGGQLAALEAQLADAGRHARAERATRLAIQAGTDVDAAILRRSTDWAQVRPEWGLAGCRAFIAAPRSHTRHLDLGGRCFLHSYDWHRDDGFAVLELILTAPMVVASWINLQYYASTVDNEHFGSGNKTLHNVVGRLGVLEGNAGDLRTGLPFQSIHDGTQRQHDPLRLAVVVAAPREAINRVLAAHDEVRGLCDNGWVHLLAMDDAGRVTHRYRGDLGWDAIA